MSREPQGRAAPILYRRQPVGLVPGNSFRAPGLQLSSSCSLISQNKRHGPELGADRGGFQSARHGVNIPAMWSLRFRRLVACPVILFLALFWIEAAVADVHETGEPQAMPGEQVVHPAGPHASLPSGSHQHSTPPDDGHTAHVCHCTHAHATGWLSPPAAVRLSLSQGVDVRVRTPAYIPTPESQPQHRPPIV